MLIKMKESKQNLRAPEQTIETSPITEQEEQPYPSDFGVWLRHARLKAGFTQQQFADLISVSQQTITAWELGKTKKPMISIASIKKLCLLTGTELVNIPNGEDDVMYKGIEN